MRATSKRVRAGAGERVSLEDVARLAPPGESVVRAQAGEPARVVPDLLAPELVRDPAGVGDEPDDGHERHGEREPAQHPRHATPPSRSQRTPRELAGADGDERGADDQEQPEPGAVADPVGMRGSVLDERGPGECPAGDEGRRDDRDEHEQSRLDAVAAEPEPEHDPEHRRRDACSRRREQHRDDRRVGERGAAHPHRTCPSRACEGECEHEQGVGGERERVPVPDRVAQPGGATAVGEDGRNRLAGERPDDPGAEGHGQRRGGESRGIGATGCEQQADGEEGDVDERPVELGPREVRRDRPGDREPAPSRRREQEPDEHAAATGQRRPTGERERPPGARDEHGRDGRPDRIAREHGAEQQRGRDRHRHFGPPHRGPS